jgi:hypothetical protein
MTVKTRISEEASTLYKMKGHVISQHYKTDMRIEVGKQNIHNGYN